MALRVTHALGSLVNRVARFGDQPVHRVLAQLQDHAGTHRRAEVHGAVGVAVDRMGRVRDPVLVEEQRILHAERDEGPAADLGLGLAHPFRVHVHGSAAVELIAVRPEALVTTVFLPVSR